MILGPPGRHGVGCLTTAEGATRSNCITTEAQRAQRTASCYHSSSLSSVPSVPLWWCS